MRVIHRLCTAILSLYPEDFRRRHGDEVWETIELRLVDKRRGSGIVHAILHTAKEIGGLMSGVVLARSQARSGNANGRPPRPKRESAMTSTLSDLVHAVRGWRRQPGYVAVVILTLAIGIGANTAIFSVVNGVMLRPLPYREPGQLAMVWDRFEWLGQSRTWVHDLQVRALRDEATLFDGFAQLELVSGRILGGDRPVHTDVARVSDNFFDLLGVEPLLGRTFKEGDDTWRAPWTVVLTHEYWTREFGQDPDIVGKTVVVGYPEMEIIGVLPQDFDYRMYEALGQRLRPELWIPHQIDYNWWTEPAPGSGVAVLARVKTGTSLAQAQDELTRLGEVHDERFYGNAGFTYELLPLVDDIARPVRPALFVLLGAVGFVLLIAIANIATLVLARTHYRANEFAIRHSLGASGSRIVRQLVTENLALAVVGGALGLWVAVMGIDLLLGLAPVELPRATEVRIDWRVLLFTSAAVLTAGVTPGLVPIIHLRFVALANALKEGGRSGTESRGTRRTRSALVMFQLALSVMLLTGAGLMVRSFLWIQQADPGFRKESTLTFNVHLMEEYENSQQRDAFFADLTERIAGLPGVTAVGATTSLPLSTTSFGPVFKRQIADTLRYPFNVGEGLQPDPDRYADEEWVLADINAARLGYFEAAGITMLSGRGFTLDDSEPSSMVGVIVDEQLAAAFWPGQVPVGQRVWVFNGWVEVVGVAQHASHGMYGVSGRPQLYIPYVVVGGTKRTAVVVNTSVDPMSVMPTIREQVKEISAIVPVADVRTFEDIVAEATAAPRFTMTLMLGFAAAALLLAALGIYGVLAFAVAQRRKEIAVRLAMGASTERVAWMVISQGLRLVVPGMVIGLAGAMALGRVVQSLLFGVSPGDPASFIAAAVGLAGIAMFASWWPARRATSVEPLAALKAE